MHNHLFLSTIRSPLDLPSKTYQSHSHSTVMMFNPPEEVKSWFNKLICYFLHFNAEKNGYFKNHEQKVKSGSILNRICLQEKGKLMEMNRNPRATKYYQDGADRLRFNMPAFNWPSAVKWNCHLHHYKGLHPTKNGPSLLPSTSRMHHAALVTMHRHDYSQSFTSIFTTSQHSKIRDSACWSLRQAPNMSIYLYQHYQK